jgi:hypothetical protein
LTLDQFDEYPDYIPCEPVESDGQIGKLLRNIMKHEALYKPAWLISMVAKSCMPGYAIPPTKCWLWTGMAGLGTVNSRRKGSGP